MASLANQTISSTYDGLIKTSSDNAVPVSGVQALEDGSGNALALSVGRSGNGVTVSGNLAVGGTGVFTNTLRTDNILTVGDSTTVGTKLIQVTPTSTSTPANIQGIHAGVGAYDITLQTSGGNVGIGGSPNDALEVAGNTASAHRIRINNANASGAETLIFTQGSTIKSWIEYNNSTSNLDIWQYTANDIRFGTNNGEKMRIDSSGNVGIGTSSPNVEMEIASGAPQVRLTDTDGGYCDIANIGGNLFFQADKGNTEANSTMRFDVDGSERMRIDSSGVLSVATTTTAYGLRTTSTLTGMAYTPTDYLTIAADGVYGLAVNRINSDGDAINFSKDGTTVGSIGVASGGIYFGSGSSATERMRIDSSGNVGIGTTGGSGKLNVGASSASAVRHAEFANSQLGSSFSAGSFITLGRADINRSMDVGIYGNGSNEFDGKIVVNETGGSLILGTVGSERMRITSGGQLQVGGTAQSFNARIVVHRDTYSIESRSTGTGSEGHLVFRNANGAVGSIITSGSSTAYNTSSDYRLKENVIEMTGALDRVDALKPSRFNFIADPEKTVDGFLAHEVQAIVPEAVTGEKDAVDEEGNPIYQGIDQSKIVPLLVGAIKELRAEIETLKSQLNA